MLTTATSATTQYAEFGHFDARLISNQEGARGWTVQCSTAVEPPSDVSLQGFCRRSSVKELLALSNVWLGRNLGQLRIKRALCVGTMCSAQIRAWHSSWGTGLQKQTSQLLDSSSTVPLF